MAQKTGQVLSFIILAIGVAMIAAVGYWAWSVYGADTTVSVAEDTTAPPTVLIAQPDGASVALGANDLNGRWASAASRSYLAMQNNQYEVIFFEDFDGQSRLYSRGTHTYDAQSGLLTLTPDPRMGEPPVRSGEIYNILTMQPYQISVSADGNGQMVWLPFGEEGERDQFHPLFTYQDNRKAPIFWVRQ